MTTAESQERLALEAGLDALGLDPGSLAVERLLTHLALLRRWGRTYNLVAPGEMRHLLARHVLDSLAIASHVGDGPLLDVGTGAGFPGLPLAIVRPGARTVLIDSAGKKVRFLRHVVRDLGLEEVEAVHERVERFSPGEEFSTITSRAFSSLVRFAESVRHLARPATRLLAMKGQSPDEELAGLPAWVHVHSVEPLRVPGLEARRHLVILGVDPDSGSGVGP